MQITLNELWARCCKLIEEYSGNSISPADDEDIKEKLPIVTNQGIKKILQVKPIMRFETLTERERFGGIICINYLRIAFR